MPGTNGSPCRANLKAKGEGEWHACEHGGAKRRLSRKIHPGVDERTLEIRAIEVAGGRRCRPSCWTRFLPTWRSDRSPRTVPTTRGSAKRLSPTEAHTLSFHPQERQAVETINFWCDRPERSDPRVEKTWTRHLAKVKLILPPKPR